MGSLSDIVTGNQSVCMNFKLIRYVLVNDPHSAQKAQDSVNPLKLSNMTTCKHLFAVAGKLTTLLFILYSFETHVPVLKINGIKFKRQHMLN